MRTFKRDCIGKKYNNGMICDLYVLDAGTKFIETSVGFKGMILSDGSDKYVCVYKSYNSYVYTRILLKPNDPYNVVSIIITDQLTNNS